MMRARLILVFCVLMLVGCSVSLDASPTPALTQSIPCGDWTYSGTQPTCIPLDEANLLIQSPVEQVTIRGFSMSIVVSGTIAIYNTDDALDIFVLEGDAVIGAQGQNRVMSVGQRVSLPISEAVVQLPSAIRLILERPSNLSLDDLPRAIDNTAFIATPTPRPSVTPLPPTPICRTNPQWFAIYTVASGDTLARIANDYDLTVEELADGNCLENASRIVAGQELAVPPSDDAPDRQINTNIIGFRADAYAISADDCTILRWDAFEALEIYLDDTLVSVGSSQEICPDETTSYSLRVVVSDETEETRELTITVRE